MKAILKAFAWFILLALLGWVGIAVVLAWANPSSFNVTVNGQQVHGAARYLIGSAGVLIGGLAALFGLGIAAVALAGASLVVFLSLLICGLILLCVALPFLLPILIPVILLVAIFGIARLAGRRKAA